MAEHAWTVVCTRMIVDTETGQTTLVDLTDVLFVNASADQIRADLEKAKAEGKLGILLPSNITVTSYWYRTNEEVPEVSRTRMFLTSPSGNMIETVEFTIRLQEATGYRAQWRIARFPLQELGRHKVFVWQEIPAASEEEEPQWLVAAVLPLDVRLREPSALPTEPPPPSEPTLVAAPESSSPPEPPRPSTRRASRARRRRRSS